MNECGHIVLEGERSNDNCYLLSNESFCGRTNVDSTELWHAKLGHMNFKDMIKLSKRGLVRGLPKLELPKGNLCGPCQLGKQVKNPHKVISHLTSSHILELLHMDLMGPTQTEVLVQKGMCMFA